MAAKHRHSQHYTLIMNIRKIQDHDHKKFLLSFSFFPIPEPSTLLTYSNVILPTYYARTPKKKKKEDNFVKFSTADVICVCDNSASGQGFDMVKLP